MKNFTTTKGYYIVTLCWDYDRGTRCIVHARTRESAIRKAQKHYPAYQILSAEPHRFIQ